MRFLAPILLLTLLASNVCAQTMRPPAVPLITHDPYFSIWSFADKLTNEPPKHWTGKTQGMSGMIHIDGKSYRFMGSVPENVPELEQKSVVVQPTQTIYTFASPQLELIVRFLTPALCDDIELLSRPLSYIEFEVRTLDGAPHDVKVYFDATSSIAVNTPEQKVAWTRAKSQNLQVLRVGTVEQPVLEKKGDDLRIDWGYLYLAAPVGPAVETVIAEAGAARDSFVRSGKLPATDDLQMPRPVNDNLPVLACTWDLGKVVNTSAGHVLLAYDDLYSVELLQRELRPYWRKDGTDAIALLEKGEAERQAIKEKCNQFDRQLTEKLTAIGGTEYAQICALSYRQCLAAGKVVADFDGTPLLFSKENFSNGCIATVDVIYPASPFFLAFNPELLKAQLTPLLEYAASKRWKFPYAPHDMGTYPLANGQVYGGGELTDERQMPVEECGNMLIMMAALARTDGNADYSKPHLALLRQWADYLKAKGVDPEEQLCTDDFAGHLAHNVNLSAKAIVGVAAYAYVAKLAGEADAEEYMQSARQMAQDWATRADDGDHTRLTFDRPGTWSQKYNIVWDDLFGFDLFSEELEKRELDFYKTKMNTYGLPLDSRKTYTKTDWCVWSATLADSKEDFAYFISPIYKFINETPDRIPFTDWYETTDAKSVGFRARQVIGGVYIWLLKDQWKNNTP